MKPVLHTLFFNVLLTIIFSFVINEAAAASDLQARLYDVQQNDSLSNDDKVDIYQKMLDDNADNFSMSLLVYDALLNEHLDLGNYTKVSTLFSQIDFSALKNFDNQATNLFVKLNTYALNASLMLQEYEQAQSIMFRVLPFTDMPYISQINKGDVLLAAGQYYVRTGSFKDGLQAFDRAQTAFKLSAKQSSTQTNQTQSSEQAAKTKATKTIFYVGNTYFTMGDYVKAVEYYTRGLEELGRFAELEDLVVYNHNIAISQLYMSQWDLAITNATRAANYAKDIDSTVFYAFTQEIIARGLHGLGDSDGAIVIMLDKVLPVFRENALNQRLHEALSFTALFYISNQAWSQAASSLSQAQDLALSTSANGSEISPNLIYFEANYLLYEHQNDFKQAFEYHKSYAQMNAEDFTLKREQEAQSLMMDYELGLAQEKALRLETDNEIQSIIIANNKSKSAILLLVIAGAVLSLFAMAYLYVKERKTRDKMSKLAMTDPLTLCPNRRSVMQNAYDILKGYAQVGRKKNANQQSPERLARGLKSSMAVAIVDVDNFKSINDAHGHDVGDQVLINIANVLLNNIREHDVMGRYGGEEFILVLPNASEDDVHSIFERIQKALKQHVCEINDKVVALPVTISMGANVFQPEHHLQNESLLNTHLSRLINTADHQVYKAKAAGRDQLSFTSFATHY